MTRRGRRELAEQAVRTERPCAHPVLEALVVQRPKERQHGTRGWKADPSRYQPLTVPAKTSKIVGIAPR